MITRHSHMLQIHPHPEEPGKQILARVYGGMKARRIGQRPAVEIIGVLERQQEFDPEKRVPQPPKDSGLRVVTRNGEMPIYNSLMAERNPRDIAYFVRELNDEKKKKRLEELVEEQILQSEAK